jgi:hypothetical protein
MTNAEFFAWAVMFNRKQRDDVIYGTEPRWVERRGREVRHVVTPYGIVVTNGYYRTRRLNPDYQAASPLTIVNPFCKPE